MAENFHFLLSPENVQKQTPEHLRKGVCDASRYERQCLWVAKYWNLGEHFRCIKEIEKPLNLELDWKSAHYALGGRLIQILTFLSRNCVILEIRRRSPCCSSLSA